MPRGSCRKEGYYRGVTGVSQSATWVLQGCYKVSTGLLLWCYRGLTGGRHRGVTDMLQGPAEYALERGAPVAFPAKTEELGDTWSNGHGVRK
jgi:hypothetical protein